MSEIVPLRQVAPQKMEKVKVTIETKGQTYVWEGRFMEAEWERKVIEVDFPEHREYIPGDEHLRLHLVKGR